MPKVLDCDDSHEGRQRIESILGNAVQTFMTGETYDGMLLFTSMADSIYRPPVQGGFEFGHVRRVERQFIATSAEASPKGSLVRESYRTLRLPGAHCAPQHVESNSPT